MARQPFDPNLIQPTSAAPTSSPRGPLTVSQVTALVKQAIESALPATIHVVGEISNFKRHSSGHLYLTLKDRSTELSCVMWRSAADKLKFAPTDGLEVVATGRVEVFERAGRYQLYIRKLEPRGVGALELAFRQLCEKLDGDGLFDERHKKPLPAYPRRIVLVTSPTGAAVTDMLRTIARRFPCVEVFIYPVRVQGPGAAEEIAVAIDRVNANDAALGGVDVMIVGRGGGSLEDLWAFNEETVARAIFASRVPIISAVGHEVDVTIADLVADLRAATPTAAAELAVPVLDDVLTGLVTTGARLTRAVTTRVELLAARAAAVFQRQPFREPFELTNRRGQLVDELTTRMNGVLSTRLHLFRRRLDELEPVVQRIAPHTHLMRRAVELQDAQHRLRWAMSRRILDGERTTRRLAQHVDPTHAAHRVRRDADRLDGVSDALSIGMRHRLSLARHSAAKLEDVLAAMSYKSILGRGFSITRTGKGRRLVRSCRELKDRQRLVTEVADGTFESEVVNLNQLELFG